MRKIYVTTFLFPEINYLFIDEYLLVYLNYY